MFLHSLGQKQPFNVSDTSRAIQITHVALNHFLSRNQRRKQQAKPGARLCESPQNTVSLVRPVFAADGAAGMIDP